MKVERAENGKWVAKEGDEVVSPEFETNAAAWRWYDIHAGEFLNAKESRHAWSWNKFVNGA